MLLSRSGLAQARRHLEGVGCGAKLAGHSVAVRRGVLKEEADPVSSLVPSSSQPSAGLEDLLGQVVRRRCEVPHEGHTYVVSCHACVLAQPLGRQLLDGS